MNTALVTFLLLLPAFVLSANFKSFPLEVERAEREIANCKGKITPSNDLHGALYGCICGPAETVKFFINEKPKSKETKNVVFIWNDWHEDRGYGIHADQVEAINMLGALVKIYAPTKKEAIFDAFFGDKNQTLETEEFKLIYTYTRGPAIDERKLIVEPKA